MRIVCFVALLFIGLGAADTYKVKGVPFATPSAAQKAVLVEYDRAWLAASDKFEVELSRRIPDFQALKRIFEEGAFEESILLRNEAAALLLTAVKGDVKYEKQLELERIAARWYDKTGHGYWAIIRAARAQEKNEDALANQWFARALSAGFMDKELRALPAMLLQIGQAWIAADFPKLTPELTQLGRRSSAGMVAAEMIPQILMPAEMIWGAALDGLCIEADQLPMDDADAHVLKVRASQCSSAKKMLVAQDSRRLREYGVSEISSRSNAEFDDQLLAPFKALECQLDDERAYVERLTSAVESIENNQLGVYLRSLEKLCGKQVSPLGDTANKSRP